MSLIVYGDAKKEIAPHVGDGKCADDPEVDRVVLRASEILLNAGDWHQTYYQIRFCMLNNCFALPHNIATILKINYCNKPANVWTQYYQYLGGGPGTLDFDSSTCTKDAVHEGDFPTFFPLPDKPSQLVAFSDCAEDCGKTMLVRGTKEMYNQVREDGLPGENIPITLWQNLEEGTIDHNLYGRQDSTGLSKNCFTDIESIIKPKTCGHITLAVYEPETCEISFLGKYLPDETHPKYRRYRTHRSNLNCVDTATALVKIGPGLLIHDSDPLPIQHMEAMIAMVKGIDELENGETNEFNKYFDIAKDLLGDQVSNIDRVENELDVRVEGGQFFGSEPNLI